jgi:hypothetical protein
MSRFRFRRGSGLGIVLALVLLYLTMAAVLAAVMTGLWWLLQVYV